MHGIMCAYKFRSVVGLERVTDPLFFYDPFTLKSQQTDYGHL